MGLSLRQLQVFLLKITKRTQNEFAKKANLYACLHGVQLNLPMIGVDAQTEASPVTFNKEQDQYAHDVMSEAINRKMAEYGR